ncbi:MAG: hypothetical protein U1F29_07300 [Planctomycetota bacterium]
MKTPPPKTLDELFDSEEARAWAGLQENVRAAGADVRRWTRVDRIAREHPLACVLAAFGVGVALAPLARGLVERVGPALLGALRQTPGGVLGLARGLSTLGRR